MQTPPPSVSSGWSARIKLHVSDKHMKSYLNIELYTFSCVNFEKLCAGKPLIFQWQTERDFFCFFNLYLVQYPHDIVEELLYIVRLTKKYKHFQSHFQKSKLSNIEIQFLVRLHVFGDFWTPVTKNTCLPLDQANHHQVCSRIQ